ncbi:unnamed protein product [Closterium sp. Naga37s-1]|nr:unnamed protein product [Closterium sp. Naga37s-1]
MDAPSTRSLPLYYDDALYSPGFRVDSGPDGSLTWAATATAAAAAQGGHSQRKLREAVLNEAAPISEITATTTSITSSGWEEYADFAAWAIPNDLPLITPAFLLGEQLTDVMFPAAAAGAAAVMPAPEPGIAALIQTGDAAILELPRVKMEAPISFSAAVSIPGAGAGAGAGRRSTASTHNHATSVAVTAIEATGAQGTRTAQPAVHLAAPTLLATQKMLSGSRRGEQLGVEKQRQPIHRRSATEKRRRHRVSAGFKQLEKAIPASWLRQRCSTNLSARTDMASLLHAAVAFIEQLEVRRRLCF